MYGQDEIIGGADSETALFLAGTMGSMIIILYVIMIAFAIVCYVLQSLGLYTIAKRRGHQRPWLAWIPVANAWLTGRLSDQFQWVAKGKKTNRAKILLYLEIGLLAAAVIMYILAFAMIFATAGTITGNVDDATSVVGIAMVIMVFYFVLLAVAITYSVFYYMALYDIYASCDPSKKVLFLVLSILFGIQAFFIFALRNKDLGMYPQYPQYPPQNMYNPNMYNQGGYNNYNNYNQNNYNSYNGYNQNNYNANGYNQNGYNHPNNSQYGYNPNNWNQDNQNQ